MNTFGCVASILFFRGYSHYNRVPPVQAVLGEAVAAGRTEPAEYGAAAVAGDVGRSAGGAQRREPATVYTARVLILTPLSYAKHPHMEVPLNHPF